MPTYSTPGLYVYTVPPNVTSLTIEAWGSAGQSSPSATGGAGGYIEATCTVTPGESLIVYVGSQGSGGSAGGGGLGGTSGGADGGDSSAVFRGAPDLSNRIVVAAGGGGAGVDGAGGVGGGTTGGNGSGYGGGYGGSQSSGGAGAGGGGAGALGVGGSGYGPGGAGGGGYYGGGGGGTGDGGGGGGSNYSSGTIVTNTQGAWTGAAGQVTIPVSAPASPSLTSPANADYLDAASGVTFTGTYNSTDGANANARALRMKISGASSYQYWNQSTSAWQSTIVWNTVNLAPGAPGGFGPITTGLSDGTTINWSMADQESLGNAQGPFASDFTATFQVGPAMSINSPAVTVTDTNAPSLQYTATPGGGSSIIAGRWLVYTAAQTIDIGAGTIPAGAISDVSWTGNPLTVALQSGVVLTNGATYYAYAAVEESGSVWSSTISDTFTVSLTPPATPTITATAGTDLVGGQPVINLTVQGSNPGGGVPTPTRATILRSDGLYVRGASPSNPLTLDGSQHADWGDAECASGVGYTYTAVVFGVDGAGATVSSVPSAASGAVTLTLAQPDLTDPLDPTTGVMVNLAGGSLVRDEPEVQGIFRPLGRKTAVVVRGDMLAEEFDLSLMFYADGDAGWQAFNSLRQRRSVVMLRGDMPGELWYVTLGSARPMTLSRTSGRIQQPVRGVIVHCTPADRPPV